MGATIVWFRQDLRLEDNPALAAAAERGAPVIPLFILDETVPADEAMGAASRWWLNGSLAALAADLGTRYGQRLILRRGAPGEILEALAAETKADAVLWNRCYEPHAVARDREIKAALKARGLAVESHNAALIAEPWEVRTGAGEPYKVFTPFWKAVRAQIAPPQPLPAPETLACPATWPGSDALDGWALLPSRPDWAGGLRDAWTPGENAARSRLHAFLRHRLDGYADTRDLPGTHGTSRLSPHLHWGEIGPRQIWHATQAHTAAHGQAKTEKAAAKFLAEVGWREFSYHLLFNFPQIVRDNFRPEFDGYPWARDTAALARWQRGQTGYPIVDAGMRELWATGWMHNRVRMIVGSFLIKDLLIHWKEGERWFADTLVDADLASNCASWQWVAGSGADAAPYFRIFNPVSQAAKFDADGAYIRKWVPEIARLPDDFIAQPWTAPALVLKAADVTLGDTYPRPMVDHALARDRAMAGYREMRGEAG